MDIFNIICGVCSIIGLLVSIFTATKVVKISKTFNCNNKSENFKSTIRIGKGTVSGSVAGRDNNINGSKRNQ